MRAVLLAVVLAAGCATETAPQTGKAVAEAPCDAGKKPQRPVFPAEALTGQEDIWVMGTTLWADHKARRAYELALEKFADECSKKSPGA